MRIPSRIIQWLTLISAMGIVPDAADAAAADLVAAPTLRWRRPAVGVDGDGANAVARDSTGKRLAIGDSRGVLVGPVPPTDEGDAPQVLGRPFERVLYRGPVRDLAFTEDGRLLVATDDGLYRLETDGRRSRLALGAGAAARAVIRVATRGELSAAATGDGLFLSRDTESWRRPAAGVPAGESVAVALRPMQAGVACWSIIAGELWRIEIATSGGDWATVESQRIALPPGVSDDRAVDVATDLGSVALAVVFPTALAVVEQRESGPPAAGDSQIVGSRLEWKVLRPQLPPGARMRRIVHGADRYWLATDRGLLESAALGGPWRRAAPRVGTVEIAAVVAGREVAFAAARDGIWAGTPDPSPSYSTAAGAAAGRVAASKEPSIVQVHRVAVHFLGLERSRMEALRRGAARRGWLPIVTLRGGAAWDRGRSVDYDQSFVSGETHFLTDRDSNHGKDYDVVLTLSWDLRDLAYERESIDVSHEAREVIELRDDVLDEITQLYFERRALLISLREASEATAPEARLLRLRADELAAGIDAWTGGWFSKRISALDP